MENMFSALTEGNDVRIPGERRGAERVKHEAEGVEVPETLLEQIETLAAGG
jgi:(2R)-3-sulfolactate dehydrogenase (NADP+)